MIPVSEDGVHSIIGSPTDISEATKNPAAINRTVFDLYSEAAKVTVLVANLGGISENENFSLQRNQAIEAGLAVRIAKYMMSVIALWVDTVRDHGDVLHTLNRCILESAVNLKFFCESAETDDFEEFVKSCLEPEREQREVILGNIKQRGHELPIEARMLNSIDRVFRLSGISDLKQLEKLPRRKNYKKILTSLGMSELYPSLQGIPSHAIHGSWVDLLLHHLNEKDDGFVPNMEPAATDARLLLPPATVVLRALRSYVLSNYSAAPESSILTNRIDSLIERILTIDSIHEKKLSKKTENVKHS